MARFQGTGRVSGVSMVAATVKTLIQLICATNHRIALVGYGIGGRGTSNTDQPGVIDILRQTTAGTASALTLVKDDDDIGATLVTTAQQTFTVEPTAGDILRTHTVHPQAALDVRDAYSREVMSRTNRLAVRANYAQNQTVDSYMTFEE